MESKLILSLDKNLLERAENYAKQHGQSLPDIIETFLKKIVETSKQAAEVSPAIKKLQGSVNLQDDLEYKEELKKALQSKYLS